MTNEQRYRQLDADLREDVLDVLQDAANWRLTRGRWLAVADAVAALEAALRDGVVDAVRDLVLELELAGPMRATGPCMTLDMRLAALHHAGTPRGRQAAPAAKLNAAVPIGSIMRHIDESGAGMFFGARI